MVLSFSSHYYLLDCSVNNLKFTSNLLTYLRELRTMCQHDRVVQRNLCFKGKIINQKNHLTICFRKFLQINLSETIVCIPG